MFWQRLTKISAFFIAGSSGPIPAAFNASRNIWPVQLFGLTSVRSNFQTVPSASDMKIFCAIAPVSAG